MKNKRFLSIPSLIFFLFILLSLSCESGLQKTRVAVNKDKLPTVSAINVESTLNERNMFKGKLSAPLLNNYSKGEQSYYDFPKGLKLVFFNDKEQPETTMKADYAIFYAKKETWEARGHVVLTNVKGDTLSTEQLFGDQRADKIYSVKTVKITDASGTSIQGKGGFESNRNFTNYTFKNVNGFVGGMLEAEGDSTNEAEQK